MTNRNRGGAVPDTADIAPWPRQPEERNRRQSAEFDKRCREAYALLHLMKDGKLDHGSAAIAEWRERVRELEDGC